MSSHKNVLEVILNSSRSVFNIQSLRMLTECGNSHEAGTWRGAERYEIKDLCQKQTHYRDFLCLGIIFSFSVDSKARLSLMLDIISLQR